MVLCTRAKYRARLFLLLLLPRSPPPRLPRPPPGPLQPSLLPPRPSPPLRPKLPPPSRLRPSLRSLPPLRLRPTSWSLPSPLRLHTTLVGTNRQSLNTMMRVFNQVPITTRDTGLNHMEILGLSLISKVATMPTPTTQGKLILKSTQMCATDILLVLIPSTSCPASRSSGADIRLPSRGYIQKAPLVFIAI